MKHGNLMNCCSFADGRWFEPWLSLAACRSVLGQDTEPQTAPDVLVDTLHGSHHHQCMNAWVTVGGFGQKRLINALNDECACKLVSRLWRVLPWCKDGLWQAHSCQDKTMVSEPNQKTAKTCMDPTPQYCQSQQNPKIKEHFEAAGSWLQEMSLVMEGPQILQTSVFLWRHHLLNQILC